ncbi:hypothetical protein NHG28_03690 [Aerococcaceae bacterium NML201209]|nr:hypothetical protein [Aerococcaceae bacterium NML201209]MCW6665830.1 hypothetical protein [Aerococcaceae bacterium NML191219]MCW6666082.1 hypothetical protein [Aerococcaceae bacterium NML190938]
MQSIYAYETLTEGKQMQVEVERIIPCLEAYIAYLRKNYQLNELPQAIVWTSKNIATKVLSNVPIPAYTNNQRIVVTPNIDEWRQFWREILPKDVPSYMQAYFRDWEMVHVIQIIGHEITHHLDEFVGDFLEEEKEEIWFEEGMVEYLSREYFLTLQQFQEVVRIETDLVYYFEGKYGVSSIEDFERKTYEAQELIEVFYYYWKSFLKVYELVDKAGSPKVVFDIYHQWLQERTDKSLLEWFDMQL